jgi:histidinol-phosphatase (PHP family)
MSAPAKIGDYHVHTHLCGHAEGEPAAYVERAIALGMTEMGIADHLPMFTQWEPGLTMTMEQLDGYVSAVRSLAERYLEIRILLGVEADYMEETEERVGELLARYDFDYVIGSVHFLSDGFGFDHSRNRREIETRGVDAVYRENYRLVACAAGTGLFDVVGHLDLPKKFGHRPADAVAIAACAQDALSAIAAAGMAIEVNTSGWRKPVGEAYPAAALLASAAALGIPLTFGSDAHAPGDVGADFARAAALARAAGYTATLRLSDRGTVALP